MSQPPPLFGVLESPPRQHTTAPPRTTSRSRTTEAHPTGRRLTGRSPRLPLPRTRLRGSALPLLLALGTALAAAPSLGAQSTPPVLDASPPVPPSLFSHLDWRMVGPMRGGRATTVEGVVQKPGVFYFGATGGGVWKTTDYGASWENLSDGFFETGSIGAVSVAPSDPNVVYVGTGSDGLRSNVIVGRGVYKSTDAGDSWSFAGLREGGQIGAVEIHPADPGIAFAAVLGNPFGRNETRGVYRTGDGGANWERVLFTSDSVGAVDVKFHPTDPAIVYAAMWRAERKGWTIISGDAGENGFHRSADGGATWTRIGTGLPEGLTGKMDIGITPADPNRVYLLVEALPEEEGLYRSDDAGVSFHLVNAQRGLMNRPFYFTNLDVDPNDPDVVFVWSVSGFKSTDAGRSFEFVSTPHADQHDSWIAPYDSKVMVQSNDGGANVTRDGGRSWSTQANQPTAELYQVDVDDRVPYHLYAGQQDNSTVAIPSDRAGRGGAAIESVGGCETGPVVPKPGDPNIVYANCKGRFGRYSRITGMEQSFDVGAVNLYGTNPKDLPYRFQRTVPIEVSPWDPSTVYHGSQYVHRTRDEGRAWETISPDLTAFRPERQVISGGPITRDITGEEHYSTLYAIEESPVTRGVIWAGANDGPVHVTRNDGGEWAKVTPPMPPEGRVQSIDASPHDAGRAFVAAHRMFLGDFAPYGWKTDDYGASWTRIADGTRGIPADWPVRVIREDPGAKGLLFAGTEFGIFVSFDDGARWQSLQLDLPRTPVTDLKIVGDDVAISTMGRGFWVLDDISALRQLASGLPAAGEGFVLFQPADQPQAAGGGFFGGGGGASARAPTRPEYTSGGIHIDYWLARDAGGEVTLEFLDGEGRVVSGHSSSGEGYRYATVQEMRAPVRVRRGRPRVERSAGAHRFSWEMGYLGSPRPKLPPGKYTARLTVGGAARTRSFEVTMDPRIAADGTTLDDMRAQFAFSLEVAAIQAEANRIAQRVDSLLGTADDTAGAGRGEGRREDEAVALGGATVDALRALRAKLRDREGISYPRPMLLRQIGYLAGIAGGAPKRPNNHAYQRLEQLQAEVRAVSEEFAEILAGLGERGVGPGTRRAAAGIARPSGDSPPSTRRRLAGCPGRGGRSGLLLHGGESLEWLTPEVLAAPWWMVT